MRGVDDKAGHACQMIKTQRHEMAVLEHQLSKMDFKKQSLPPGYLGNVHSDVLIASRAPQEPLKRVEEKRKPPSKQAKIASAANFQLLRLKTLDLAGEKFFRVFKDSDVLGNDLPQFNHEGRETLVDSAQDDDVESDEEVMRSGVQTSLKDLLIVKDWLRLHPDKIRKGLRTFKLWAPLCGGKLPYKQR